MPSRHLALVVLAVSLVGCTRYQSRNQVAKGKPSLPSPYAAREPNVPPPARSPLNMPATPAAAVARAMPPQPTELSLVPPLPREPMPPGFVVQPPKMPTPGVVPAAGTLPPMTEPPGVIPANFTALQPGKIEKDPGPEPTADKLPSPFAKAAATTMPAPAEAGNANFQSVRRLAANAADRWQKIATYEARLTRRETVGGKPQKEEEVLYRARREPFAIYMKNTSEVGKGREVLYNPMQHGDKMHIVVGEGDSFFLKAGSRAPSMSPDSRTVTEKSRYNIRDSGFGNSIGRFNSLVEKVRTGRLKPTALHFAGAEVRNADMAGFTLERVDQTVEPGEEPLLQKGGKRLWFFDAKPESPSYGMPVLVVTFEGGREVEYYRFDRFRIPANLTDADFSPERMGKK